MHHFTLPNPLRDDFLLIKLSGVRFPRGSCEFWDEMSFSSHFFLPVFVSIYRHFGYFKRVFSWTVLQGRSLPFPDSIPTRFFCVKLSANVLLYNLPKDLFLIRDESHFVIESKLRPHPSVTGSSTIYTYLQPLRLSNTAARCDLCPQNAGAPDRQTTPQANYFLRLQSRSARIWPV